MKSKFLVVSTVAMSVLFLFVAFSLVSDKTVKTQVPVTDDTVTETANKTTQFPDTQQTQLEFSATQSGQVALELLQANATVETQDFGDAGKFITSINGLVGNNQNYWAFYLNGEYAEQGVSQTVLTEGDSVKFVYEAITAN